MYVVSLDFPHKGENSLLLYFCLLFMSHIKDRVYEIGPKLTKM